MSSTLDELREEVRRLESSRHPSERPPVLSTGIAALDQLLPDNGLRTGSLCEWLAPSVASGAGMLSLLAARQVVGEDGALVVIDRQRGFFPPAASAVGINLNQVILVRPGNHSDELWVLDQALRCEGVAAVWAMIEEIDWRTFRRFQLAAESQHAVGMLVRSSKWLGTPSWSEIQLLVEPRPSSNGRRWRVELTRGRCHVGAAVELEIDEATGLVHEAARPHETHPLPVVARLARPAAAARPA